jgi:hypothetical protein
MKRIYKIAYFATLILIIPLSSVIGQDKKNEQKIKIVVNDGSATKVIMDTVLTGDKVPDSLTLKDGSVVHLKHPRGERNHFFVTYSSDDKDGRGLSKEITVITNDSLDSKNDEHGNVMYYRNDREGNHRYKVISRSSGDGDDREETVFVNRDRRDRDERDTFDKDSDSNVEKTRYVIAKDGMVVTIEGTDETKAKELAKEIEQKLGVTGKEEKKEVSKSKQEKKINK